MSGGFPRGATITAAIAPVGAGLAIVPLSRLIVFRHLRGLSRAAAFD